MKITIKNFFHHEATTLIGASGSEKVGNPLKAWSIGLLLALVVFLAGIAYIMTDFYTQFLSKGNTNADVETVSYPKDKVILYAKRYEDKESAFVTMRSTMEKVTESVPRAPSVTTNEVLNSGTNNETVASVRMAE